LGWHSRPRAEVIDNAERDYSRLVSDCSPQVSPHFG
jgi:hypothetical protein